MAIERASFIGLLGAVALGGGLGCGGADGPGSDGRADAGADEAPDAAVAVTAEVGTGVDRFEVVQEGAVLPLIRGPQGGGRFLGYHVVGAVRLSSTLEGASSGDLITTMWVESPEGERRGRLDRRVPYFLEADGRWAVYGFDVRIDDCCRLAEQPFVMGAGIRPVDGATLAAARISLVAGSCETPSGLLRCDD